MVLEYGFEQWPNDLAEYKKTIGEQFIYYIILKEKRREI